MARRSDHSREELYALAMDAAQSIVKRDGLRALTARNVATTIGYSPGTLYNLFSNLDDLALHVNASTLDALHDAVAETAGSGDPEADLKAMLTAYLKFLNNNTALWTAIFEYRHPSPDELPEWYLNRVRRLMGLVEQALAPLFASDEDADLKRAAGVLWSSLHGICTLARDGRLSLVSAQSVPEMAESLIMNYLVGLRARTDKANSHA